ncbi:MAG TPA: helix-turn-helix domain-containing protein [Phycisphaerae bacterium]|nr:helix-turn-helix domain-containing protein [Phycisphaerae bacterium]
MVAARSSSSFFCPHCKRVCRDPLYRGPLGHAPQEMCFDCWASEWGMMVEVIERGGNWQPLDAALFLLCQGFNHREAADLIGVHRNSLYGWIRHLRRRPELTPDWLLDRARRKEGKRR